MVVSGCVSEWVGGWRVCVCVEGVCMWVCMWVTHTAHLRLECFHLPPHVFHLLSHQRGPAALNTVIKQDKQRCERIEQYEQLCSHKSLARMINQASARSTVVSEHVQNRNDNDMRYLRALRSAHGEFILVHKAGQFLRFWLFRRPTRHPSIHPSTHPPTPNTRTSACGPSSAASAG